MKIEVKPISEEDRNFLPWWIIGKANCPHCNQEVKVVRDRGAMANPLRRFLEDHKVKENGQSCKGSLKILDDF